MHAGAGCATLIVPQGIEYGALADTEHSVGGRRKLEAERCIGYGKVNRKITRGIIVPARGGGNSSVLPFWQLPAAEAVAAFAGCGAIIASGYMRLPVSALS
jgi:hypothetical protein